MTPRAHLFKIEVKDFFESCVPEHLRPYFPQVAKAKFPEEFAEIAILKSALDAPPDSSDYAFNCSQYAKKSKHLIRKVALILQLKNWD